MTASPEEKNTCSTTAELPWRREWSYLEADTAEDDKQVCRNKAPISTEWDWSLQELMGRGLSNQAPLLLPTNPPEQLNVYAIDLETLRAEMPDEEPAEHAALESIFPFPCFFIFFIYLIYEPPRHEYRSHSRPRRPNDEEERREETQRGMAKLKTWRRKRIRGHERRGYTGMRQCAVEIFTNDNCIPSIPVMYAYHTGRVKR